MKETKKNSITIANVIALLGLSGIGVVTFFGNLFHSKDGTPGGSILAALALLAGLTFLLVMSIKAKSADNNPDKWKYVEIVCVIAYVAVSIICSTPFQRFFYILDEKENLKYDALHQVNAIEKMYDKYEKQYTGYLADAVEQIRNYNASKQKSSIDPALAEYVKDISSVESWSAKAEKLMSIKEDDELTDLKERIEVWNLMDLPSIAVALKDKSKESWKRVENHINSRIENNKLIPVIRGGGVLYYSFDGYVDYSAYDLGTAPKAKFTNSLSRADGNTVLGWIIYTVLNLMVLLNYFVTRRSGYVGPIKNTTISGTPL